MAFSDYKNISEVQQQFLIVAQEECFLETQATEPSPQFVAELCFNQQYFDISTSEAARTELIIFPILREVYKPYAKQYELWVQKSLHCDENLRGTPDYLLATRSELGKRVLAKPLLMVVEAKRNDFEERWGQCLAELVAAQILNNDPQLPVYGIVTDGKRWEFGRLIKNVFSENSGACNTEHLSMLMGSLHYLFKLITGG
jgi:hypothetical protein